MQAKTTLVPRRVRLIHPPGERGVEEELRAVGMHPWGMGILRQKADVLALRISHLSSPAGNILKQQMLSLGGDVALASGAVACKQPFTEAVLLGTRRQITALLDRLKGQPYGLPELGREIRRLLLHIRRSRHVILTLGDKTLRLGTRTHLIGVLNVTPDSFSDGGRYADSGAAVARALSMAAEGADIIEVGGESSRPGSDPVKLEDELARVLPVIRQLIPQCSIPVAVDTTKAEVARQAIDAGATMVNDISALRFDNDMARVVADAGVGVVLMHMKGVPRTMQRDPMYDDCLAEVYAFLSERVEAAVRAGIGPERIVVDPGIGFGKTAHDNLVILNRLGELRGLGKAVLVGPSRKSFIGAVLGLPADQRLEGTAAAVSLSVARGAHLVRVHDVKEMGRVAKMTDAMVRTWA
jgi:dihydropteroate synthase